MIIHAIRIVMRIRKIMAKNGEAEVMPNTEAEVEKISIIGIDIRSINIGSYMISNIINKMRFAVFFCGFIVFWGFGVVASFICGWFVFCSSIVFIITYQKSLR